jgi:serine/threonine-protein kinase
MTTARHLNHHPDYLPRGLEIDGWRILKRLDAGGFGAVYLVEKRGRRYALKIARVRAAAFPEDAGRTEERTLRELICLLRLRHANVVRVRAYGQWPDPEEGYVYFVMEYVEGDTLKAWARRNAPTVREALRLFAKLADALEAAHRLGILHRDLKPANVLVGRRDGEPKLLDFGAGDFPLADPLTGQSLPPGTITHRSPEAVRFERQNEHNAHARYEYQPTDDLYALGVTFYEVLTGRAPFELEPSPFGPKKLAAAIEFLEPPAPHTLNPNVPLALSNLVVRLLAKKPSVRHASAEALRRDLTSLDEPGAALDVPLRAPGAFGAQGEASAQPTPPVPTPAAVVRSRRVHRAVEALALVGVVGVLVLLALFLTRKEGAPSRAPASPTETTRTEPSSPAPMPPAPPAAPPGAVAEAAPMLNASPQQESPNVKTPTPVSPSASPPSATPKKAPGAASLKETCRALVVGSSAWLAAGCAGVPVRPPPAECPQEARDTMREFGWWDGPGRKPAFAVDANNPEGENPVFVPVGSTIVSRLDGFTGKAPKGTLAYGRVWVDEKRKAVWGRWTEAELPGGRRVPICLEIVSGGRPYTFGGDYAQPGKQPGTVGLPRKMTYSPVEEWTDAEKWKPKENRP